MNFPGILDKPITAIKLPTTIKYGQNLFIINKDIININVAISLTLASNL